MRFKAAILVCSLVWLLPFAACQFRQGRRSPHETTRNTVDSAEISINYGRPYMRGRKIMGALVPYGRVWCPGADMCTKLTTSKNLQFGNFRLPAGSYSLWMLPTAGDWTLIFSKEADVFHTNYDPDEDFGRIKLEKRQLPEPVEQLTFEIVKNPSGSGGAIRMRWETTEVSAPFVVAP